MDSHEYAAADAGAGGCLKTQDEAQRDPGSEIARLQAKLDCAEREKDEATRQALAMKDDFLLTITHEFKTPLSVIISALQTMELTCRDALTDRIRRHHGVIRQNANRQLRLVNNLLDVTSLNAGQLPLRSGPVDIVHLTGAVVDAARAYAGMKGIPLTFVSAEDSLIVGLDGEKYERVLLNLLSNAVKFTPRSKTVSITLSHRACDGQDWLCLCVQDEGIGIPEDRRERVFEKFGLAGNARTKQAEGTGIGLYLVKRFVVLMGGEILLESACGAGSAFTVRLPVAYSLDPSIRHVTDRYIARRLAGAAEMEFSDVFIK